MTVQEKVSDKGLKALAKPHETANRRDTLALIHELWGWRMAYRSGVLINRADRKRRDLAS